MRDHRARADRRAAWRGAPSTTSRRRRRHGRRPSASAASSISGAARGDATLLPWEPAQHKQFPRLLAKDRRRSLSARLAYYEAQELLRPDEAFVRTIDGGRHAVWLPADDSKGAFAYSIGLGYLHDLPEILLVSPLPAMSGATSRALALTVNAIAAAMLDGLGSKPGDRYAVVADIVARTVHKECTLDHAALAQSCFVLPSARIEERTLGGGGLVLRELHGRAVVSGAGLPAAAAARAGRLRSAAAPAPREGEIGDRPGTGGRPREADARGSAGAEAESKSKPKRSRRVRNEGGSRRRPATKRRPKRRCLQKRR